MSVLELEHVHKRYRRGHRELTVLRGVSLTLVGGEVVCVTGGRRSGRSTLLRIAAGLEPPDEGRVRFAGTDAAHASQELRRQIVLGSTRFISPLGRDVCEHVMAPLLAVRIARDEAGLRAHRALQRVGAEQLAFESPATLVPAELLRIVLARAIVREPRVLILDEPTNGVDPTERDPLLSLIQAIAQEAGIATLLTAGEHASVTGADRVLRLSEGELIGRTAPASADVVDLKRAREPTA